MPRLNDRHPKYRRHRHSGQAIVTLDGKDHYLGPHGSQTSIREYDRLIAERLAHGRRLPVGDSTAPALTVNHVILKFFEHAESYYRRADGTPTSEVDNYRQLLRVLRQLYGHTPAADFGPCALKAVREHMIGQNWCRRSINKQVHRLCAVFKWAAAEEMLPASIYAQLKTVAPLKRGRCAARETPRKGTVPEEMITAIQPHVSEQVWDMIQLQRLSGPRPGELVFLRPLDLKPVDEELWVHEPAQHKTAWREHTRTIRFGPKAIAILMKYVSNRPVDAYLFSPTDAEEVRRAKVHQARKTPPELGNNIGTNRKHNPRRRPRDHYDVGSYRRAIQRACDQAFPPPPELARHEVPAKHGHGTRPETKAAWMTRLGPDGWAKLKEWWRAHRWSPHRLRKNAGTEIRKHSGVEMAKTILGQRSIAVTELYAERDERKAEEIIRRIG